MPRLQRDKNKLFLIRIEIRMVEQPRWTNKLHKKTVKSYFESLNIWPEETAELERDDDNVRHNKFVMFVCYMYDF